MPYKHLTIQERETIQLMLWQKKSIRSIAKKINRSPSSVSREVNKNYVPYGKRYLPRVAHRQALIKRKTRGRKDRLKNELIRNYVVIHLKKKWSPQLTAFLIPTAIFNKSA